MPQVMYKCSKCFRTFATEKEARICEGKPPKKCLYVVDFESATRRMWNLGETYLMIDALSGEAYKVTITGQRDREHDLEPIITDTKTATRIEKRCNGVLVYIPEWNCKVKG